ncbi:hypothetical protein ACH0AH_04350 [Microbacterium paludicola]|uniref:hypothetical protein n=1 Tax=Microbacterium paludicola TaxID=300019 RepID=UPI00387A3D97
MSALDLFTAQFLTALVVITSGAVFLLETVVRRESGSGRYWAAAFVAGILVAFCYMAWAIDRGLWIAVALGNAAFVSQMGLMWLGCRVYNGHLGTIHQASAAAAALVAFGSALLEREAGDWAGAPALFLGIAIFAALGAFETLRGALREVFASWGLTFVLGAAALYYLARTAVFLTAGPDSVLFTEWFGTNMTSLVTVALTVVAVVSTSVLRVASVSSPAVPGSVTDARRRSVLLSRDVFMAAATDMAGRGERAGAPLTLLAIRIDGLDEIASAFGPDTAELIEVSWHSAVHRHLPIHAPAGSLDDSTVAIVLDAPSAEQAAAAGNELRQGLIDDLAALKDAVVPAIGVGYALAEDHGYDPDILAQAAREAARRSASASGMPVMRAGG